MATRITQNNIVVFFLSLAVLVTAGCGFHLRGVTQLPAELQTIIVDSSDPYGPLTRLIKDELHNSGITISDEASSTKIPSLRIIGIQESQNTASIYRDGITAEYQLVMTVDAQLMFPDKGIYPLNVKIFRSFFDNPLTALAKDTERSLLQTEMMKQAAQQITRRLLAVYTEASNGSLKPDTPTEIVVDVTESVVVEQIQAKNVNVVNGNVINSNVTNSNAAEPSVAEPNKASETKRQRSALLPLLEPLE